MNRSAFRQLLIRYIDGTATGAEKATVDSWYELLYDASLPPLSEQELDTIEQQMWQHIEKNGHVSVTNEAVPILPARAAPWRWIAAAAIVIGMGIACWWFMLPAKKITSYAEARQQRQLQEAVNTTNKIQRVMLADGSYVLLQPNSKIAYPQQFEGDKREVYMEGDVFFQVAKNASQPFYVYANEVVTKVLGTSFDVQALPNNNAVKVIVHTGKVTVYQRKSDSGEQDAARRQATILTPNQQVVFNRQSLRFVRGIALQPQVLNNSTATHRDWVYNNTSAAEVFAALQKAYGIAIVFDEEVLRNCSFTGTFTNETFFEKVSLVCKAIEADYEQADGQVIINAHNCEP